MQPSQDFWAPVLSAERVSHMLKFKEHTQELSRQMDMQETADNRLSRLLVDAEQSAQQGNQQKAYRSSLKATGLAPEEPLAWYLRSRSAPSPEEKLFCLSRLYALDPDFPLANGAMHTALGELLKHDPALVYVDETPDLYQVRSGHHLLLNVPKNRAFEEHYLRRAASPLRPAFAWTNLALLALFLGGVGAFLLAPVGAVTAFIQRRKSRHAQDRARLLILLIACALIWLASIPLSLLFLIHFLAWSP